MGKGILLTLPPSCALLQTGKIYVDFLISPRIMYILKVIAWVLV